MRSEGILKPCRRRSIRDDVGGKSFRIHDFDRRSPDEVDTQSRQCGEVSVKGTRIRAEIFMRRKLGGVDEDRYGNSVGAAFGARHKREVTGMERAHGRHQRKTLS